MKAIIGQRVPTQQGAELATDVYLPDGAGPFPVLLTRTPYGRAGHGGRASAFTRAGYAFVAQDCRGKYDSSGTFRPLLDEPADGAATLDWIANQRWCNGRIGMVGLSYLGMVQVPAAASGHEALRCIAPGVAPGSMFTDWLRYDGCFALANAVRWSMTHAVCPTRPAMEHFRWDALWRQRTLEEVFERAGYECAALRQWVAHDRYDDYWRGVDQRLMHPKVRVPGLHPAGWFDHISRGQFEAYQGIRSAGATERARGGQRLVVGPWGHMTIGQSAYGEWDFGPAAALDLDRYQRRFLDLWMRDIDDGISEEPPVYAFVMGINRWAHFSDWPVPEAREQPWHLRSGGAAATLGGDGRLSQEPPGGEPPDSYRYDPSNPVPTWGGPIYWGMDRLGPIDQRPILGRADVLYYRSDQLPAPLPVVGPVELDLWFASDAEDTDLLAKLCVAEANGRITVLTIGSLRLRYRDGWDRCVPLPKEAPVRVRIRLGHLAYVFPQGSRVALVLTSSSYPRILPHPNTMAATWQESSPKVAQQRILHDAGHPSRLLLPVVEL